MNISWNSFFNCGTLNVENCVISHQGTILGYGSMSALNNTSSFQSSFPPETGLMIIKNQKSENVFI